MEITNFDRHGCRGEYRGLSTIIDGCWDSVWSVNGKTGDVIVSVVVSDFVPNTAYEKGAAVMHENKMYIAKADFTSGSEFDPNDWSEISGGGIVESVWEKGEGEKSVQQKGTDAKAEGQYSVAEGEMSRTIDAGATAIEGWNKAKGAHAEGGNTMAGGNYSHTEGNSTVTNNPYEHAEGHFNISHFTEAVYPNAGNTIHSVGIGSNISNRKNAFEIMQNGDAYLIGVGDYDGTNIDDAETIQEVINAGSGGVTKEYVDDGDTNTLDAAKEYVDTLLTEYLKAIEGIILEPIVP